uniref:Protein VP3 n=1 Tax=Avian rotavirus A TaxID=31563 RepID=A0A192GQK0_9REOV|nr:VP3 [Avian rotavirus A]
MKVIALRRDLVSSYADTQVYEHDVNKDYYENAYLISNITAHNVLYVNYSIQVIEILNKSGIASLVAVNKDELEILIKSNYTYDYYKNIVYLHDYSYYNLNEIRTDQYWLTTTNIEEYILPGWKLTYVGQLGIKTRGHYTYSFVCQNTATDDDIIYDYIYSNEVDFLPFLLQALNKRLTTALNFHRLSNRVFREYLYSKVPKDTINIGPRNESMFTLLRYPYIMNYAANEFKVSDLIRLTQEKWVGAENSQFDIGQFKNMCNVLSTIYYYYNKYHAYPRIYMLGSAPSYWLYDLLQVRDFDIETWDPLDTPFSKRHHKAMFTTSDIEKLSDNSILYIDIRSDRNGVDWREWRQRVEDETKVNLEIMYKYLQRGKNRICCCKITAMDIEHPVTSILLHFPTTNIQSECYVLCTQEMLQDKKRFVPKGAFYSFINNTKTDNVFISPAYKVKPTNKFVVALYSLSNESNDRDKVIDFTQKQKRGIITLRMNNTFNYEYRLQFKSTYDYLYLPSEVSREGTIVTSYDGYIAMHSLSLSLESKATGNNHLFISFSDTNYDQIDSYCNHMGISRRSHSVRFSEAATTLSGYMFRDITNGKFNLINTNVENAVSGHVYNALIYFRYNYRFDLLRWINLHAKNEVVIQGGKYYEHAPPELLYACQSALVFARLQNDLTLIEYVNSVNRYIITKYDVKYADDPNYYIHIDFVDLPFKYTVSDPHLTGGLLLLNDFDIQNAIVILRSVKEDLMALNLLTQYTYMLTDSIYVANVDGYLQFYYKLYMKFYRKQIIFGQSRMFIPHITLAKEKKRSVRIDATRLVIKSIKLRKIKSDVEYYI